MRHILVRVHSLLGGFILAPGYIDLSELLFVASDSQFASPESSGNTKYDGNRRILAGNNSSSNVGIDYGMEGSALDIAVFQLVSSFTALQCF